MQLTPNAKYKWLMLLMQNSKYKCLLQGKGLQIRINNKTIIEFGSRRIRGIIKASVCVICLSLRHSQRINLDFDMSQFIFHAILTKIQAFEVATGLEIGEKTIKIAASR